MVVIPVLAGEARVLQRENMYFFLLFAVAISAVVVTTVVVVAVADVEAAIVVAALVAAALILQREEIHSNHFCSSEWQQQQQ